MSANLLKNPEERHSTLFRIRAEVIRLSNDGPVGPRHYHDGPETSADSIARVNQICKSRSSMSFEARSFLLEKIQQLNHIISSPPTMDASPAAAAQPFAIYAEPTSESIN